MEHVVCVCNFPTTCVWYISHSKTYWSRLCHKIQRDIAISVHRSECKVPINVARFYLNLNFLKRFSESPQISKFMKICPVWSQVVPFGQKDKQTKSKHDKDISCFSILANAPKNLLPLRCEPECFLVQRQAH